MKLNTIDLHSHSNYSDGTETPEELLAKAQEIGLDALALTDHDTVAGIPEFLKAGGKYPDLLTIAGVEISTIYFRREIHIVGIFLNHSSVKLQDFRKILFSSPRNSLRILDL